MKFKKNKSLTSFENQLPQNRGMKAGHSKKLGGGRLADWLKHNLSKQIATITQLQKGMQSQTTSSEEAQHHSQITLSLYSLLSRRAGLTPQWLMFRGV